MRNKGEGEGRLEKGGEYLLLCEKEKEEKEEKEEKKGQRRGRRKTGEGWGVSPAV